MDAYGIFDSQRVKQKSTQVWGEKPVYRLSCQEESLEEDHEPN